MTETKRNSAFITSALTYDQTFTHTALGQLQRRRVWRYLDRILDQHKTPIRILELNCGTGEDALYLARKGHEVLATDRSPAMLELARSKAEKHSFGIEFRQTDIRNLHKLRLNQTYDLIFSNFGGLNCLNQKELSDLPKKMKKILSEKGQILLVIMPTYCFVEDLYMLLKGRFRHVFRRNRTDGLQVPIASEVIDTWYYSPASIREIFQSEKLQVSRIMTVGFTPSYLNAFLVKRPGLLRLWSQIGDSMVNYQFFTFLADHYLVHFTSTNTQSS